MLTNATEYLTMLREHYTKEINYLCTRLANFNKEINQVEANLINA